MNSLAQILGGGKVPSWVSGRPYQQGQVVLSPADNYQPYVRVTAAGAGTTDPSADSTNYRPYGGRAIKSIQRGTISMSNASSGTATISAVNTAKSVLHNLGGLAIVGTSEADIQRLSLTNSTTVTASVRALTAGTYICNFQVVEYY